MHEVGAAETRAGRGRHRTTQEIRSMFSKAGGRVPVQGQRRFPTRALPADVRIRERPAASPYLGPPTGAQEAALEALINTDLLTEDGRAPHRMRAARDTITVFIPAHNEAASIGATLRSLQRQTRLPTQIVVVCDNCTDDTAAIAARHGAFVFNTVGNKAKKAGALNQALTRMLPSLRGDDLVLVMDADSLLSDDWLRSASATLDRRSVVGAVRAGCLGEPGGGLIGQMQ